MMSGYNYKMVTLIDVMMYLILLLVVEEKEKAHFGPGNY